MVAMLIIRALAIHKLRNTVFSHFAASKVLSFFRRILDSLPTEDHPQISRTKKSDGHTHSTRTPEQWATQILGLDFVTGSALFLLNTCPDNNCTFHPKVHTHDTLLGANLAFFRPPRILRADNPPMLTHES
jgi:hypothetical protein